MIPVKELDGILWVAIQKDQDQDQDQAMWRGRKPMARRAHWLPTL